MSKKCSSANSGDAKGLTRVKSEFKSCLDLVEDYGVKFMKEAEQRDEQTEQEFGEDFYLARRTFAFAYLGVTSAWENFLEATFTRYMRGQQAPSGYAATINKNMAGQIPGNLQRCSEYLRTNGRRMNWAPLDGVIDKAKLIFDDGRPYSLLKEKHKNIVCASAQIRNCIAHGGSLQKNKQFSHHYDEIPEHDKLYLTPAKLLLMPPIDAWFKDFDFYEQHKPMNNFSAFVAAYEEMADIIVPDK